MQPRHLHLLVALLALIFAGMPDVSVAQPATADRDAENEAAVTLEELAERSESEPVTFEIPDSLRRVFKDVPRDADDLKSMQTHMQELVRRIMPCTVAIRLRNGMGSGVIVSEDGYVLTAGHVAGRPGQDVTFILQDGRTVRGKTLGANFSIDSGLMKISTEGKWPYAELGRSEDIKNGQWCLALGHPGGFQRGRTPPLRFGRVLYNRDSAIVSDCTLVGGDSGGPLFDASGRVIGIHSRIGDGLRANLHVPVDTYRDTWDRLAKGDTWGGRQPGGPFIGVVAAEDAEDAEIGDVVPAGAAAKAGIQRGDVILKFNGKGTPNFRSLADAVSETDPGDRVKVELRRADEILTLDLVVGKFGF